MTTQKTKNMTNTDPLKNQGCKFDSRSNHKNQQQKGRNYIQFAHFRLNVFLKKKKHSLRICDYVTYQVGKLFIDMLLF